MMRVPMTEIAGRIVALQALLSKSGIDAAIIRQNADLYYFTGTVQDAHLIIPASSEPLFLVRRDVARAEFQSPVRPVVPLKSMKELPQALFDACRNSSPTRIGMELDVLPAGIFFFYDEKLFPKQQIVDVSPLIRQVRSVKSPWEVDMMRGASAISRAVADAVPQLLVEGMTELDLNFALESVARKAGHLGIVRLRAFNAEMNFGHILAGADAATPAYSDTPTGGNGVSPAFGQGACDRPIMRGEVLSVDTMLSHHGYLNDQTRNFCIGEPPRKLEEAYELCRSIHTRFKKLATPGAVTGDLYSQVCGWVEDAGWSHHFMGYGDGRVSFIGHGLGIEVDEFPFIAKGQKMVLLEGMTFAFEPKFIVPGEGIVGFENTYLVTSNGLESLNTATEEMVIV
jgi:Xaa-Pro dipeptidase